MQSDSPVDATVQIDDGVGSHGVGTNLTLPAMTLTESCRSVRVIVNGKPTDLPITPLPADRKLVLLASGADHPPGPNEIIVPIPNETSFPLPQAFESADQVWTPAGLQSSPAVRGPTNSLDDETPYDATSNFVAGRSPATRRTVWLGLAVFAILAIGLGLLLRRRAWIGVTLLAGLWLVGGAVYVGRQSPVSQMSGLIFIPDGKDHYQIDSWLFRTSLQSCDDVLDPGPGWSRPIFGGQAKLATMWIEVNESGWHYHYHLNVGGKMAFVGRTWATIVGLPTSSRTQGSLQDIAREEYARPGESVRAVDYLPGGECWLVEAR